MSNGSEQTLYERIYDAVGRVPRGKVATYGDIAAMVGDCDARTVGYALNEVPKGRESEVPWQRIINSQGGISTRGEKQRMLLEEEGVVFDGRGRVPLARFRVANPADPPTPDEPDDPAQLSLF
jgi:methylated-DNA-protein-cysteine methyltransferase related protein